MQEGLSVRRYLHACHIVAVAGKLFLHGARLAIHDKDHPVVATGDKAGTAGCVTAILYGRLDLKETKRSWSPVCMSKQ